MLPLPNQKSSSYGALKSTISSQNKARIPSRFRQPIALSQVKRESQLIARNPLRFLESFADGRCAPTPADTTSLTSLIGHVDYKTDCHYQDKMEDFKQKQQLTKTRTLLLNMSNNGALRGRKSAQKTATSPFDDTVPSTPASGTSSSSVAIASKAIATWDQFDYHNKDLNKNSLEDVEKAIQMFIDEIRNSDIDNIVVWISTVATLNDFKLPYGLPANLRMPTNPETLKDPMLASFVESASDEFLLLDAEYHAKLDEVSGKLKENFESTQTSRWSPRDSALLYYIMSSAENNPQASWNLIQGDLARRLFPEFNHEEVITHKYRLKMKRAWEEKRDNIIKDWVRDKEELQNKTNTAWDDIQEKLVKKMEQALQRSKQREKCKYWKELLEDMRKEKRLKIRRIQIMVEPYERLMEEREINRMQEDERKRREQKELIEQYKKMRLRKIEQQQKDREMLEQELEKNAQLQAKYNRTRVHVRQFELEKKQEAQKELERLKEEECKLKKALLENTKEKVEIDYHPSNILADTHVSLVRRHEIQTQFENPKEEAMINFFRERYSFSAETILKDRRVRLESKLRDAGLIDSSYARQVLLAMEPKAKPHLHSQIKFDTD